VYVCLSKSCSMLALGALNSKACSRQCEKLIATIAAAPPIVLNPRCFDHRASDLLIFGGVCVYLEVLAT